MSVRGNQRPYNNELSTDVHCNRLQLSLELDTAVGASHSTRSWQYQGCGWCPCEDAIVIRQCCVVRKWRVIAVRMLRILTHRRLWTVSEMSWHRSVDAECAIVRVGLCRFLNCKTLKNWKHTTTNIESLRFHLWTPGKPCDLDPSWRIARGSLQPHPAT